MTKDELIKVALTWYDSGAEDRQEFADMVESLLDAAAASALAGGLGIWTRPRPPMFHLCTLDVYQTDRPLNKGVWEIIGFEDMDTEQEVFMLRRFSPAEPSGPTGEIYRAWRGLYEDGHMHIWRRGPDLLDPRFLMPSGEVSGATASPGMTG